jgi:GrpB-like predicted nucleotidyltransferase (UPF0157 family)
LNSDDPKLEINQNLEEHWKEILSDPSLFYFGIEEDGMLVSSCTLAIIKNLTRSARPYGLIENVVTHPEYRKRGNGRKGDITTHLVHVVEYGKNNWNHNIRFRDTLRNNPVLAIQYQQLKEELAEKYPDSREKYTEGEGKFITDTFV